SVYSIRAGDLGKVGVYANVPATTVVGGATISSPARGILIVYKGTKSPSFIQFKAFRVSYREGEMASQNYQGAFQAHGEDHPISSPLSWMIDTTSKDSPAYPAETGGGQTWMWDAPLSPVIAFKTAYDDLVTKQHKDIKSIYAEGIFVTYIIIDGFAVF